MKETAHRSDRENKGVEIEKTDEPYTLFQELDFLLIKVEITTWSK